MISRAVDAQKMNFQYTRTGATKIIPPSSLASPFPIIVQLYYNKLVVCYSLIQMKCQGGNKYALSITVKFDQSTRRFGRISFARLFKLTKHIALLFHLLSPHLLSCMRGSRNVRKNMHIIKTITKLCAHDEFRRRWDLNSVSQVCAALQRPIISKLSA